MRPHVLPLRGERARAISKDFRSLGLSSPDSMAMVVASGAAERMLARKKRRTLIEEPAFFRSLPDG